MKKKKGCVKGRVILKPTKHSEAAGTLKVKINNPILTGSKKKILFLFKKYFTLHHITKRQGSESQTAYKTTDKSVKNRYEKRFP